MTIKRRTYVACGCPLGKVNESLGSREREREDVSELQWTERKRKGKCGILIRNRFVGKVLVFGAIKIVQDSRLSKDCGLG